MTESNFGPNGQSISLTPPPHQFKKSDEDSNTLQSAMSYRTGITSQGLGSVISYKNFKEENFHADVTVKISNRIERVKSEYDINVRPKIKQEGNKPYMLTFDIDFNIDSGSSDSMVKALNKAEVVENRINQSKFLAKKMINFRKYVWFPDVFKAPKDDFRGVTTGHIVMGQSYARSSSAYTANTNDPVEPTLKDYEELRDALENYFGEGKGEFGRRLVSISSIKFRYHTRIGLHYV